MELAERMAVRRADRWWVVACVAGWLKPGPRVVSVTDLPARIRQDIGLG